jgi:hypothetical protein
MEPEKELQLAIASSPARFNNASRRPERQRVRRSASSTIQLLCEVAAVSTGSGRVLCPWSTGKLQASVPAGYKEAPVAEILESLHAAEKRTAGLWQRERPAPQFRCETNMRGRCKEELRAKV